METRTRTIISLWKTSIEEEKRKRKIENMKGVQIMHIYPSISLATLKAISVATLLSFFSHSSISNTTNRILLLWQTKNVWQKKAKKVFQQTFRKCSIQMKWKSLRRSMWIVKRNVMKGVECAGDDEKGWFLWKPWVSFPFCWNVCVKTIKYGYGWNVGGFPFHFSLLLSLSLNHEHWTLNTPNRIYSLLFIL